MVTTLEDVDVGLQVELRRAGVEPVRIVGEGVERIRRGERGKGHPLDAHRSRRGDAIECARLKDVGSGVDLVRRGFAGRRLLDEGEYAAVVVGWNDAEMRG